MLVAALAERMRAEGMSPSWCGSRAGTTVAEALRQELLDRSRLFRPLTELLYITAAAPTMSIM